MDYKEEFLDHWKKLWEEKISAARLEGEPSAALSGLRALAEVTASEFNILYAQLSGRLTLPPHDAPEKES